MCFIRFTYEVNSLSHHSPAVFRAGIGTYRQGTGSRYALGF
jgi:hypothetical protein